LNGKNYLFNENAISNFSILLTAYLLLTMWNNLKKQPQLGWYISIVGLTIVCVLAFLWHLGSTGLIDETEPLFAEAARQMTVTGDWITPYFNGETRFDKPPLIYWLMAIGYQVLGVNAWAARLPSALAAIALTLFCFFALRFFGYARPKTAAQATPPTRQLWLAAWIGATLNAFNIQTLVWARTGVSDMLLSACLGGALLGFFWGYVRAEAMPRRDRLFFVPNRGYLAFYGFSGLAVLAKGPVGIVIPGLTILLFSLYLGNFWQLLREMGVMIGSILFLLITVPWYVLVIFANGQTYIDSFFGYHNFERFTGVVNNHAAPWYFYFLVVFVGFLPWSVYLPIALARLKFWQRSQWQQQPRRTHLGLFALAWFVAIFGFFTIAVTKLPSYTLPLLPAASILVALFWSDELARVPDKTAPQLSLKRDWGRLGSGISNLLVAIAMSVALWLSPRLIGYDPVAPNLGELFGETGLHLRGSFLWAIASVAIALLLWRKDSWRWLLPVNILAFTLFLVLFLTPASDFVDRVRQKPIRDLAAIVVEQEKPGEPLLMLGFKKPTLVFYTQRPVKFVYAQDDTQAYLQQHPPVAETVLILGQPSAIANAFNVQADDYQLLGKQGEYELIRIEKERLRAD
jgi:4-amino-4-deoxy-L-arabinose transferase-like glycosyltransferase